MDNVQFDYQALIQQLENHIALKMITALTPDKSAANMLVNVLEVFIQNGVSVEKAMKILGELVPILTNHNEKETDKL